jgi:hypothetical protein
VIKPLGVATATQISAELYLRKEITQYNYAFYIMLHLLSNEVTLPCGVNFRNLLKSKSRGLDDKVIDRELVLAITRLVKNLTQLRGLIHVDFNSHVVVRNLLLGFGQTASNNLSHAGCRNVGKSITSGILRSVSGRDLSSDTRSSSLFRSYMSSKINNMRRYSLYLYLFTLVSFNIFLGNNSSRAGTLNLRNVNTTFFSNFL